MIYAEVACFPVCYKSNQSIGKRYNVKANTVSISISKLIKKGYLFTNGKRNEHREIMANQNPPLIKIKSRFSEKSKAAFDKNQYIDNSIDNIKNNVSRRRETIATEKKKREETAKHPMDYQQFYEWTKKSTQPHIRIIGEWADTVKPDLRTIGQWQEYISRNVRVAKKLTAFSQDQLEKAYDEILREKEKLDYTPALETILKKLTK